MLFRQTYLSSEPSHVCDVLLFLFSHRLNFVYDGKGGEITPPPVGPVVGAQKGGPASGSSSTKTQLAIAVPLAIIGERM